MVLSFGTWASTRIVRPSRSRSTIRSMSWKYSIRMREAGRSRSLGRDQAVDACAQVLEHEVLLGRRLAVVDFLRPLLERKLDAERLVDRERDVEKVEAVDAEIVDRVALRLDFLARDVAGLGDDIGHGVEGRGHHQLSGRLRLSLARRRRRAIPGRAWQPVQWKTRCVPPV